MYVPKGWFKLLKEQERLSYARSSDKMYVPKADLNF